MIMYLLNVSFLKNNSLMMYYKIAGYSVVSIKIK